jgi:hypothetical protein
MSKNAAGQAAPKDDKKEAEMSGSDRHSSPTGDEVNGYESRLV